jgi:hypothetical protein
MEEVKTEQGWPVSADEVAAKEVSTTQIEKPDLDLPEIKPPKTEPFNVSTGSLTLPVRQPPIMPKDAKRSGHCTVEFSLSPEGWPRDVNVIFCTEEIFRAPTRVSVEAWKFPPTIRDGKPVKGPRQETRVSYRLTDKDGKLIPEPGVTP